MQISHSEKTLFLCILHPLGALASQNITAMHPKFRGGISNTGHTKFSTGHTTVRNANLSFYAGKTKFNTCDTSLSAGNNKFGTHNIKEAVQIVALATKLSASTIKFSTCNIKLSTGKYSKVSHWQH